MGGGQGPDKAQEVEGRAWREEGGRERQVTVAALAQCL